MQVILNKALLPYDEFDNTAFEWYPQCWGKACYKDGAYHIMTKPISCKDYLMDIHFRQSHLLVMNNWKKEEVEDMCYYMHINGSFEEAALINNVKNFLNVYEKKHRLIRTIVEIGNIGDYQVLFIRASQMWAKTCIARSFYLSLLRMCIFINNPAINDTADLLNNMDNCTDKIYITQYSNIDLRKEFDIFFKKPRLLMKGLYAGQENTMGMVHGQTGLIHQLYMYHIGQTDNMNQHIYKCIKEAEGVKV